MLDLGATTFWEDFNLEWTPNACGIDRLVPAGMKDIHGDSGDRYITDPGNTRLPYHPEAFHANRMRRRGYPIRQRWAPVYRTGKHRKRTMR